MVQRSCKTRHFSTSVNFKGESVNSLQKDTIFSKKIESSMRTHRLAFRSVYR